MECLLTNHPSSSTSFCDLPSHFLVSDKESTKGFKIFKVHFSYNAEYHNAGHIKVSFSFWSDGNITTAAKKQSHYRPGLTRGFQEVEAPRFQDNWHMKVVRLSALHTGHLYSPGNIPGTHLC